MGLSKKDQRTIEAMEWGLASKADKEAQILKAMEWTPASKAKSTASVSYNWFATAWQVVVDSFYVIATIIFALIVMTCFLLYSILGFIVMVFRRGRAFNGRKPGYTSGR